MEQFDPLGISKNEHQTEQIYWCEMPEFTPIQIRYCEAIRPSRNYTELLARSVRKIAEKKFDGKISRGLEIGTGCGLASILVASMFRRLMATDIDPRILAEAKQNFKSHHIQNVDLVLSDLFQSIAGEKFDLIFSAPPQKATFNEGIKDSARDAGKTGREFIDRLIDQAGRVLVKNGYLLFVQNSLLGIEETKERLEANGFEAKILESIKVFPSGATLEYFERLDSLRSSRGARLLTENGEKYYFVNVLAGKKK